MVDVSLLVGRLVLIALLYLFLLAAVRTGLAAVRPHSAAGREGLALKVTSGPPQLEGLRLPIESTTTIGRSPESDVVISDEFMSSHHARVVRSASGFVLEDLGSTNGTVLNGRKVSGPSPLHAGDKIELGTVTLKVVRS